MSSTFGRHEPDADDDIVVPAHLSFLSIYNPSLGRTDERLRDQIVFYSSKESGERRRGPKAASPAETSDPSKHENEENEKLRQIGLAQGMVEFARTFSRGETVDSVETEKSRIILHELESSWWIVAVKILVSDYVSKLLIFVKSIHLTKLPSKARSKAAQDKARKEPKAQSVEHSAREVSPPALLIQQLLHAHSIFLLHEAPSLDELFNRLGRSKFCAALDRFWTRFIWNWDVLLHGNPAVDMVRGTKLAAGGELGIGVGEEEWGSGEREVLEGFVERTPGLLDLVVSKFDPQSTDKGAHTHRRRSTQNPNVSELASPTDGIIFSGTGAISKESLRSIANWMELVYVQGDDAYGIQVVRRPRVRGPQRSKKGAEPKQTSARGSGRSVAVKENSNAHNLDGTEEKKSQTDLSHSGASGSHQTSSRSNIPPPIATATRETSHDAPAVVSGSQDADNSNYGSSSSGSTALLKYLTLGYGSSWNLGSRHTSDSLDSGRLPERSNGLLQIEGHARSQSASNISTSNAGRFLIGLQGNLEDDEDDEDGAVDSQSQHETQSSGRILPRTVYVELDPNSTGQPDAASDDEAARDAAEAKDASTSFQRLRIVVYKSACFMYTFLFESQTPALALPSFYRALHHQLGPLERPLLASTSPATILARLASNALTANPDPRTPIYDLIYDPETLTIHSSIPNIPPPSAAVSDEASSLPDAAPWTRIEALNVYTQLLATFAATRQRPAELERTGKTNRGWWVVWMRLPPSEPRENAADGVPAYREAFLVRKASDRSGRRMFGSRDGGGSGGWAPAKLAEGIGVDARRYVEGLLNLNR
ncbi:MAG: hypothetical protein M1825_000806 [Sarcosagium campestre]|nr:MAG: hypothetical protein M1825_000806 [Sarcosagium campestre]